ncbi:LPD29 domain-containing protein [Streptomyces anulatus]
MLPTIPTRYVSAELKRQLTAEFPGVKFSVRSDVASLSIRWTDGPATEDVEALACKMKGSHWNGEERGYTRTGNTVTVTIDGERVTGDPLVDHVSTDRELSDEARAEATALWSAAHDGAEPAGMCAAFACGQHVIREQWATTQVLQIANLIVLPARWAAHLKAGKATPAPKATAPARKKAAPAAPKPAQAGPATTPAPTDRRPIVIAHSPERGIYVTGTRRSDGIAPLMRGQGFEWKSVRPRYWFLPDTGGAEHAGRVDEVRTALEHAGMTFGVTPAPADTCSVCGKEDCANEVCGTERPATAPAVPAPAPTPSAPAPVAQRRPRAVRSAEEAAVLADVGEYIKDGPGIGVHTAAAATAAVGKVIRSGAMREDHLTRSLPAMTAAVTATAVQDMRRQGLTHEQIKQRLERKRAEAQQARDLGRVTVADAMLAAHAGIVADEEAQAARAEVAARPAPELEPATRQRLALVAAPATPVVPVGRPGVDAGAHRIVNTGDSVEGGTAFAFRCLDCEQRATLADFPALRCTDGAESAHYLNRAHRLLDDVTFREATRFELIDELGHFGDDTGPDGSADLDREQAEVRLSYLLRKGATHSWYRGELRLRLDGRAAGTIKAAPDAPAPVATGMTYRKVPVPAFIAQGWEGDPGAAWRAGVDAALAHPATGAHTL